MRKYILIFCLYILSLTPCLGQDCTLLPKTFTNYSQAEKLVGASNFKIKESVNTTKSSWIRGAKFYSCDGLLGYFILYTDKHSYIYQDMPIEIWEGFKNAESFGSYYNANIKGKWLMIL